MTYDILPFTPTPERAEIVSNLMRKLSLHPTLFSDRTTACEEFCIQRDLSVVDMCEECVSRMRIVASILGAADTLSWEVWRTDKDVELVGLVTFTDITKNDAKGHYVFFDGRLRDKTHIIKEVVQELFDSLKLSRITIEIPSSMSALIRHAARKLGFTGAFKHRLNPKERAIWVEGVKRDAIFREDHYEDLVVLGLTREDFRQSIIMENSEALALNPS